MFVQHFPIHALTRSFSLTRSDDGTEVKTTMVDRLLLRVVGEMQVEEGRQRPVKRVKARQRRRFLLSLLRLLPLPVVRTTRRRLYTFRLRQVPQRTGTGTGMEMEEESFRLRTTRVPVLVVLKRLNKLDQGDNKVEEELLNRLKRPVKLTRPRFNRMVKSPLSS